MKVEEIKKAVDDGKLVFWKNSSYRVIKDNLNQYLIQYTPNKHCVGLTNKKGVLNENEKNFYTITFKPVMPIFRS